MVFNEQYIKKYKAVHVKKTPINVNKIPPIIPLERKAFGSVKIPGPNAQPNKTNIEPLSEPKI